MCRPACPRAKGGNFARKACRWALPSSTFGRDDYERSSPAPAPSRWPAAHRAESYESDCGCNADCPRSGSGRWIRDLREKQRADHECIPWIQIGFRYNIAALRPVLQWLRWTFTQLPLAFDFSARRLKNIMPKKSCFFLGQIAHGSG